MSRDRLDVKTGEGGRKKEEKKLAGARIMLILFEPNAREEEECWCQSHIRYLFGVIGCSCRGCTVSQWRTFYFLLFTFYKVTERSCLNDTTAVKIGLRCFFGSFLFLFLAFLFPFSPLKTSHDGALRSICSNQLKVFYSSALEPIPHEYKSQLESPPRHRIAVEAAAAAIKAS